SRSNPTSDADRNRKGQLVRQRHGQADPVERGVFQVVGRHRDLHGFTFPLEAPPRDMLLSVGPRSWFVTRSPVPGSKPEGVLLQKNCMNPISSFAWFSLWCVAALTQTCSRRGASPGGSLGQLALFD